MDPYLKKIVIEDFFSGSAEAYEKWQRIAEFRIQVIKNKEERQRRTELKRVRLAKQGITLEKISKFEEDE